MQFQRDPLLDIPEYGVDLRTESIFNAASINLAQSPGVEVVPGAKLQNNFALGIL